MTYMYITPFLVCCASLPPSLCQEPGTAKEIKAFAANHGVEFDLFAKIDVNGSHAHPLYRFLKSRVHKGLGSFIKWNFEKVKRCYNSLSLCVVYSALDSVQGTDDTHAVRVHLFAFSLQFLCDT